MMNLARQIFRLGQLDPRVDLAVILCWILFFPRSSPAYFLTTAIVISLFSLRLVSFMKTVSYSTFSYLLGGFNLLMILAVFFSQYRLKSILAAADIILMSFYFLVFFLDKRNEKEYLHLLVYIISLVSLIKVIDSIFVISGHKDLFFGNPIFQGIASGIAFLIVLYYILEKFSPALLGLLILNAAGVFVSESKAAFIGIVGFSLLMVLLKNRKLIPVVIVFAVLALVIPNPIRNMFHHSLYKDPYAANRLDMWQMSLEIAVDNLPFGVGPDNFSEVSKKYNFKQTGGPANYFKRPQRPHNDYLKILAETGLAGALLLVVFLWALMRKLFSSSLFNIFKILILYLLFQAFLFNLTFHPFFFFIILFLLKNLFQEQPHHTTFTTSLKAWSTFLLILVLTAGYILPYYSLSRVRESHRERNVISSFNRLQSAIFFNPLDANLYYLKANNLLHYFKQSLNLEAFYSALESLKTARRLNRHDVRFYLLESDFYLSLWEHQFSYDGLSREILRPLEQAEVVDPLNTFLKLRKAEIYLRFNHPEAARQEALKALELEPEYVAALYFLQRNFQYFDDDSVFRERVNKILKKAEKIQPKPGTYLYDLYRVPTGAKEAK